MLLHLVRHTSVAIDGQLFCYGATDVEVRDTFIQEADETKQKIKGIIVDAAFSSPLSRAAILADHCGYPDAQRDDRLKEMNFGHWELRPWIDIGAQAAPHFDQYPDRPIPGGESLMDMKKRVAEFIYEQKAHGYLAIIVFCHAGVINCARAITGGCSLKEVFHHIPPFGSLTTMEIR